MTSIPAVVPPLPREHTWKRNVPPAAAYGWLSAGWRDFTIQPAASISYGVLVFLVSVVTVVGLFALHLDYILFPAFAGFMVAGPIIGIGLYEKSRRIEEGKPVSLWNMIFVKPELGGQILVRRRAASWADAAVDARGGHPLCAVFRPAPVPRPRPHRPDAVHDARSAGRCW